MIRICILLATILWNLPTYSTDSIGKYAIDKDLTYLIEIQGSESHGHTPLWLNANKHGLSSLASSNGYLRASLMRDMAIDSTRKWAIGYGADFVIPTHYTSKFFVHQAYAEGRWLHGTLTIGSKEYNLELKNNLLSSGSQTLGINARPVPQIRIALPEYWTLPFAGKWIHLKGHIAYGYFTDDNWQKDFIAQYSGFSEHVLYHSKAAYLKIGKEGISPFSAELGLEMAAQFGGKNYVYDSEGREYVYRNPSNFASFLYAFIPGGKDQPESTYQNEEGNHLGSYTARLNYDNDNWGLSIYADHFFEDHSAMFFIAKGGYGSGDNWDKRSASSFVLYKLKDIMLGTEVRLKACPWLSNIVLEYLYTKYQSGPLYHEHGKQMSDQISGCDNYYNHGLYTGWQHWGQVIGNPLYRSPLYNNNGKINVYNNRFSAVHLGFCGHISHRLNYRILGTYQNSVGTYDAPYKKPKDNYYLMGEAEYHFTGRLQGWNIRSSLGFDWGYTLGNNQGFQLTVSKRGLINPSKK